MLMGGTGGYARFVEPGWLRLSRHEIPLQPEKAAPIRLVQLSDLHASRVVSLDYIAQAVNDVVALKPDLICLTGDYITGKYDRFDAYAEVLARLPRCAPTVASLGNHDGGAWARHVHLSYSTPTEVCDLLRQGGIRLLRNEREVITLNGRRLNLVGLGDLWAGEFRAQGLFATARTSDPTLVLSHNPDTKDLLANVPWDLLLSGHTHGGQMRVPLYGAPYAPVRDRRFVSGLHRWNDRWLHINRGVGNLFGIRFNCRPEISLLTLT